MLSPFAYALHRRMAGYQTEMLHHFQELLKIPSVRGEGIPGAPFGRKNREALDYVLRLSEQFGLTTVNLDGYLGYSEYGSGEEYVCSISHLDVVPPGEGWKHPPFGAWEENGVIYARGAGDNKPGSIAGLYALRCMKELGYEPKHKVRAIYGCAEETGMEDLEYYWKSQPLPIFGFTPDSDGYDIINAEKGRMEVCLKAYCTEKNPVVRIEGGLASNMVPTRVTAVFDRSCMTSEECCRMEMLRASQEIEWQEKDNQCVIEFRGVAAHAAMPETGHSAISEYARFACKVLGEHADQLTRFIDANIGFEWKAERLGIACEDKYMGPLTLSLGQIQGDGKTFCVIGDIRYPTSTNASAIQTKLGKISGEAGLDLRVISAIDGHCCTCEKEFDILRKVCLDKGRPEPRCRAISGGTYAKKFAGRLVAFGGCGDGVHAPDEFVEVQDFYDHMDIVAYALYRLSGGE